MKQPFSKSLFQSGLEGLSKTIAEDPVTLGLVNEYMTNLVPTIRSKAQGLKKEEHLNTFLKTLFQKNRRWRSDSDYLTNKFRNNLEKYDRKFNSLLSPDNQISAGDLFFKLSTDNSFKNDLASLLLNA